MNQLSEVSEYIATGKGYLIKYINGEISVNLFYIS